MQDYGFREHYKKNMFVLQVRVHSTIGREVLLLVREGESGVMHEQ